VRELEQAFLACPSQWEGRLDDGCPFYIWHRWGTLSVHIGPAGGMIDDAVGSEPWFEEATKRQLDGWPLKSGRSLR
jgi:hypothetical protein